MPAIRAEGSSSASIKAPCSRWRDCACVHKASPTPWPSCAINVTSTGGPASSRSSRALGKVATGWMCGLRMNWVPTVSGGLLARGAFARLALQGAGDRADFESETSECVDQIVLQQLVIDVLPAPLAADQSGLFQHRQVPRNRRGTHCKASGDVARGQFLRGQIGKNLAARLRGECFEHVIDRHGLNSSEIN